MRNYIINNAITSVNETQIFSLFYRIYDLNIWNLILRKSVIYKTEDFFFAFFDLTLVYVEILSSFDIILLFYFFFLITFIVKIQNFLLRIIHWNNLRFNSKNKISHSFLISINKNKIKLITSLFAHKKRNK